MWGLLTGDITDVKRTTKGHIVSNVIKYKTPTICFREHGGNRSVKK
jgi:hypothetical protein